MSQWHTEIGQDHALLSHAVANTHLVRQETGNVVGSLEAVLSNLDGTNDRRRIADLISPAPLISGGPMVKSQVCGPA